MLAADDTIAAIATARGGARGLVRLSGTGSAAVVASLADDESFGSGGREGMDRVVLRLPGVGGSGSDGSEKDGGSVRLPAQLLSFRGPRSYTGQDGAEILTVGNPAVLERVLGAVLDAGARLATPGEFSARAYLFGKISVEQAEGIAARIAARRDDELAAAERVRTGAFGARCGAWADRLAGMLALVEAGIDFTDQEDVVAIPAGQLRDGLLELVDEVGEAIGGDGSAEAEPGLPRVVLVGPPNAGKSTLFNALVGRARSVVSETAGTTRDAIAEEVTLGSAADGPRVMLVDLAGLEETGAAGPDSAAQAAAREAIASADLLVACDPRGVFDSLAGLDERAALRVRTKADLVAGGEQTGGGDGSDELAVCALDGWHLDALREAIADQATRGGGGDGVIPRHRRALAACARELREAVGILGTGDGAIGEPEAVASLLRGALDEIGSVSGRISADAVLGRVFASFCVGK